MENTHKPGWRTSEFALSLLALLLPVVLPLVDTAVHQAPQNSPTAILGSAIIAVGYSLARALVKKPQPTPSTFNDPTPPGPPYPSE